MKYDYYMKGLLGALAVAFVLFGAACSKDKGSNNNNTVAAGTCGVGYTYSAQYGCLTQGNCGVGSAMVNGYCQQVGTNYGNCQAGYINSQYGCLQQSTCASGSGLYNGSCVVATTPNTYNNGYNNGYPYTQQYPNYYQNSYYQQYPYYGGYSNTYNPYYYGNAGVGGGAYFGFGFGF